MAIWFQEGSMQGKQATIYADDATDVTNDLEKFGRDNHLKRGSTCICIDTSEVFLMKTDGTWKKF